MPPWKRTTAVTLLAAWIGWAGEPAPFPALPPAYGAESAVASPTALKEVLGKFLTLRESSFTVKYKGPTGGLSANIEKAISSILDADDSLGFTVSSYRWSASFSKNEATIKVQVGYWENAKQTEYVIARTREIAKRILKPGMNEHQKVKAIHDWVLLNVAYDRTLVQHSAYAALTRGVTVCQGYALLTYRLLNEAGIPNRIIEGTVSSGLHAWNLVKVDGDWYHLDTTFDDPVPDLKGRTTYGYYLISDRQIKKDHRWTKTYPAAVTFYGDTLHNAKKTDKKNVDFYDGLEKLLGYPYLEAAHSAGTEEELAAKIRNARKSGQTTVTVRWIAGSGKPDLELLLDLIPALKSVSVSSTPFPLGDSGDTLLKVDYR